jgi:hypothetical protein
MNFRSLPLSSLQFSECSIIFSESGSETHFERSSEKGAKHCADYRPDLASPVLPHSIPIAVGQISK